LKRNKINNNLEKVKEEDSIKTIGLRISNKNQIGSFFFFRFQVASRKFHERKNEIFLNTFGLKKESNFATIWMNEKKEEIQIVIQGKEKITKKMSKLKKNQKKNRKRT
jgi:hypothetical protein